MNNQAYQNVRATVVTNPIRGASNTGMKNNGRCQPATSTAMMAVAASREWVLLELGLGEAAEARLLHQRPAERADRVQGDGQR